MLQRLKQSITDELEQVVNGQKQASNDPVKVIERNADLLKTQTPDVSDMDFIKDGSAGASSASPAPIGVDSTDTSDSVPPGSLAEGLSPSELDGKLRKFAKYEEKYPQLLKAYRVEKKKGDLVKLFEKVLSENTPCQTISEPQQMLDFLDGLNNKAGLLKQELERVSDAHSRLRKRSADTEAELKAKLQEAEREIENLVAKDCEKDDEDVAALRAVLKEREEELDAAQKALEHAQSQTDSSDLDALHQQVKKLETELASSKEQVKDLEDTKTKLSELESVRSELADALAAKDQVKKLEAELAEALDAKAEMKSDLKASASVSAELDAKLKSVLAESAEAQSQVSKLQKQLEDAVGNSDELEKLSTQFSAAQKELDVSKASVEDHLKKMEVLKAQHAKETKALEAELATLQKGQKDHEAVKKQLSEAVQAQEKLSVQLSEAAQHADELKKTKADLEAATKRADELEAKAAKAPGPAPAAGGKKKKKGGQANSAPAGASPADDKLAAELAEKTSALAAAEKSLSEVKLREEGYKQKLVDLEAQIVELKNQDDHSAELETAIAERDAAQEALAELEKKSTAQAAELEQVAAAKEAAEAKAKDAESKLKEAETRAKEAETRAKEAESEAKEAKAKAQEAEKAAAKAEKAVETAEKAAAEAKAEAEAIKKSSAEAEAVGERAQSEINAAKDAAAAMEAKAEAEVKAAKDAAKEAESKAKAAISEHKAAAAKVAELETSNKQLVQKRAELEKSVAQLTQQVTKHKDDLVAAQAKVKEFDVQKRNLEELEKKLRSQADIDRRLKVIEGEKTRLERQIATGERTRTSLEQERADLLAQLRGMQGKVSDATATAKAATVAQDGLRRQVDELGMRVSESAAKIDVLRDELADAQRLAHERLLETTSMRQMLAERADGHDAMLKDARDSVKAVTLERDQLEQEVTALGQRLVRETEQLRARMNDLSSQLDAAERERSRYQDEARELRGKCDSMERQLQEGQGSSQAVQSEVSTLRRQLETSESNSRELSRAHALLKKVSEDTQTRLERLQKAQRALNDDLDALRQENSQLRGRRSSSISQETGPAKSSEQEEYVKNVILGFLEHRDQRRQLLPVLSMLLKFDSDDERRFWAAFS